MKIKVKEKVEQEIEVDVEFPFYREHDYSSDDNRYQSVRYTKTDCIDGKIKRIGVCLRGNNFWQSKDILPEEVELDIEDDYELSKDVWGVESGWSSMETTQKAFDSAMQIAEKFFNEMKKNT